MGGRHPHARTVTEINIRRPSTSPSSAAESSERWPRSNSPSRARRWSCSSVAPSSAGAARPATPGSSGRATSCRSPPRRPCGRACAGCCGRTARSPCARGSPSSRGSRASSPPRRRRRSSARPTRCRPWPCAARHCTRSSTARGSTPDTGAAGCSTSSPASRRSPRRGPPLTEVRCSGRRSRGRGARNSRGDLAGGILHHDEAHCDPLRVRPGRRGVGGGARDERPDERRRCSAYAARAGASAPWRRVTASCWSTGGARGRGVERPARSRAGRLAAARGRQGLPRGLRSAGGRSQRSRSGCTRPRRHHAARCARARGRDARARGDRRAHRSAPRRRDRAAPRPAPYPRFAGRPRMHVWRGLRPCTPDGLPMIGRAPNLDNLTLATGHGMWGLQLAPLTAELVASIVRGSAARRSTWRRCGRSASSRPGATARRPGRARRSASESADTLNRGCVRSFEIPHVPLHRALPVA